VTSGNVALVAALSQRATDLTNDGIMVSSDPPKFFYTAWKKLKLDLLAEATRNAYARARTLADNSGAHVGVLTSAEQGVFQVTAPYSNEISEDGEYDTTSIPKDVTAVVTWSTRWKSKGPERTRAETRRRRDRIRNAKLQPFYHRRIIA